MQYNINEKKEIVVSRSSDEPNFDRACESAYRDALFLFGCEDGHLLNVKDSERSTDSVVVEFKSYRHYAAMGGQCCVYIFEAWVERNEDET